MFATSTILESKGAIDTDSVAFLNNAGITDATTVNALNNLVIQAKQHGWWQLCSAIYPLIGGTSTTCKFNLKDPRDLDAAFRLTFNGAFTFASTGITPDASTAFAQTHLVPSSALVLNDSHLSYYSRTSAAGSATASDIGGTNSGTQDFRIIIRRSTNAALSEQYGTGTQISTTVADASGFFVGSRTTITSHTYYRNGSSIGSSAVSNAMILPTFEIYIGADNNAGTAAQFGNKECSFVTIGAGISSALALIMYNDVQAFQTALGRQV